MPVLGDVPILNFFFRNEQRSRVQENLIVFITPRIVRDSCEIDRAVSEETTRRQKAIEEEIEHVYLGVKGEIPYWERGACEIEPGYRKPPFSSAGCGAGTCEEKALEPNAKEKMKLLEDDKKKAAEEKAAQEKAAEGSHAPESRPQN